MRLVGRHHAAVRRLIRADMAPYRATQASSHDHEAPARFIIVPDLRSSRVAESLKWREMRCARRSTVREVRRIARWMAFVAVERASHHESAPFGSRRPSLDGLSLAVFTSSPSAVTKATGFAPRAITIRPARSLSE